MWGRCGKVCWGVGEVKKGGGSCWGVGRGEDLWENVGEV